MTLSWQELRSKITHSMIDVSKRVLVPAGAQPAEADPPGDLWQERVSAHRARPDAGHGSQGTRVHDCSCREAEGAISGAGLYANCRLALLSVHGRERVGASMLIMLSSLSCHHYVPRAVQELRWQRERSLEEDMPAMLWRSRAFHGVLGPISSVLAVRKRLICHQWQQLHQA